MRRDLSSRTPQPQAKYPACCCWQQYQRTPSQLPRYNISRRCCVTRVRVVTMKKEDWQWCARDVMYFITVRRSVNESTGKRKAINRIVSPTKTRIYKIFLQNTNGQKFWRNSKKREKLDVLCFCRRKTSSGFACSTKNTIQPPSSLRRRRWAWRYKKLTYEASLPLGGSLNECICIIARHKIKTRTDTRRYFQLFWNINIAFAHPTSNTCWPWLQSCTDDDMKSTRSINNLSSPLNCKYQNCHKSG